VTLIISVTFATIRVVELCRCSSERCGGLLPLARDDPRAGTAVDPDGRDVVLLARIWEDKIAPDHPELVRHLDAIIQTVATPDHLEPDTRHARTRFYRRAVGPGSS
jgi:hypothetical protein